MPRMVYFRINHAGSNIPCQLFGNIGLVPLAKHQPLIVTRCQMWLYVWLKVTFMCSCLSISCITYLFLFKYTTNFIYDKPKIVCEVKQEMLNLKVNSLIWHSYINVYFLQKQILGICSNNQIKSLHILSYPCNKNLYVIL